jgi:hypothetical protein
VKLTVKLGLARRSIRLNAGYTDHVDDPQDPLAIIPIVQTRTAAGIALILTYLEAYDHGLRLHGRVIAQVEDPKWRVRMVVPSLAFRGKDDQGNPFAFAPSMGGGQNDNGRLDWDFSSNGMGGRGLDPEAGELRLDVAEVQWRDFMNWGEEPPLVVQHVDWRFTVPLLFSPIHTLRFRAG